jgi:2'-5' RNA ligase
MRAFIGLNLPNETTLKLSALQDILKETDAKVNWIKPVNLHITLKFLGEIGPEQLESAKIAVKNTADHFSCFTATLAELAVFPDTREPRIIWVGLGQGNDQIKQLAAALETALSGFGITQENRSFLTHITIGRVRSGANLKVLFEKISACRTYCADTPVHFKIDKIALFESKLTSGGPVYEKLAEENLKIN